MLNDDVTIEQFVSTPPLEAAKWLMSDGLTAQEIAATYEALNQILPSHDAGSPYERFSGAVSEALEMVANMYSIDNDVAICIWLAKASGTVHTESDMREIMQYFLRIVRFCATLSALAPPKAGHPPR
jgi:hypothetical protein